MLLYKGTRVKDKNDKINRLAMRKEYLCPEIDVRRLDVEVHLLGGSGDNGTNIGGGDDGSHTGGGGDSDTNEPDK